VDQLLHGRLPGDRELGRTAIDEYIEHKSTIIRTGAQAPSWVGGVGEK
jgi:hypothetical protein